METQMTESCFGNDIMKTARHIIWSDQLTEAVTADKAFKLFVIRSPADLLEVGFKLLPLQQQGHHHPARRGAPRAQLSGDSAGPLPGYSAL